MKRIVASFAVLACCLAPPLFADSPRPEVLPNTERLDWEGPIDVKIVDGAHRFLDRRLAESVRARQRRWSRDTSSAEAYVKSIEPNRRRFRKIIGLIDERVPVVMERFGDEANPALVAETDGYRVLQVRWRVLDGVDGEGLLLEPKGAATGHVVAIPDADQTPEQLAGLAPGIEPASQFARRLAENGFRVVVPVLVSRDCTFSGNPRFAMTNQPHREWIYRQAYEMGRHVIGYEVQKIAAAVDWLAKTAGPDAKIGVAGYGEGGLIALYAAAADTRIDACLVSGYFDAREHVWQEPIYRNVWSLLDEFGDAEIASLIQPRALAIEQCAAPQVDGPPPVVQGRRGGAAPGRITTPDTALVRAEFDRAVSLGLPDPHFVLVGEDGTLKGPGSPAAITAFAKMLGHDSPMPLADAAPADRRESADPQARQGRQVGQIVDHVQLQQRLSDHVRDAFFLNRIKLTTPEAFADEAKQYRQVFWNEVIGPLDDPLLPPSPRSRKIYDEEKWTGYEVVLDVFPDVWAWGILCLPKDLKPGERRPVVVCQHGLEGLPEHTITREGRGFGPYQAFTARLAEQGFITFAPFNLYRGQERFRMLQRKANLLKLSLFSIITRQHEQILNWLGSLPQVDKDRIAFYGLSYGGKTAMRVPALLEGYCLSICSADFNDWIRKNVTVHARYSYMFTGEWEMFEFDLGNTFNYAEMAYLICPRPFMVERGHHDGVAPDPWVAYEYAKIRYLYDNLGLGDRTRIEFFNGPHQIHAVGTFQFLHHHLNWPE